ncbi:hypothetical protein [Acidicapsa acidisoli]|uniref:hypothetical protein n=1 Tax=Acidicapsa acidisoli TaxID=1615681 RepID=UPI0021E02793|nr:hypothetical protein [Acidicapsa acidisoli]
MKKATSILLGISFAAACVGIAAAQETTPSTAFVPKVLQITREFTKPGKSGAAHDTTESAFVRASANGKIPAHYIAMNSLTGKSRALYLTSYDSYEAWQKVNDSVNKNQALSAEFDRAAMADGELLDSMDSMVLTYQEEMSFHPMADLSKMRYMEASVYQVRPGHGQEWRELVKMVKTGYEKANLGAHWAMFEMEFGADAGEYVVFTSRKSLDELDKGPMEDKQFVAAIGEDGMKKLDELVAASVSSSRHELFSFNPKQSYVPDEWVKNDPFWEQKSAPVQAAKLTTENK